MAPPSFPSAFLPAAFVQMIPIIDTTSEASDILEIASIGYYNL
jgi:hypothetical protein